MIGYSPVLRHRRLRLAALATGMLLPLPHAALAQAVPDGAPAAGPRRSCPQPAVADVKPSAPTTATRTESMPAITGSVVPDRDPFRTRIVVVEWKIKPGRECEFLEYWSTRSTIPDRSGLIGEFLNEVDRLPWVNWSLDEGWTTFYNVGIWRDAAAFEEQIGKFIDNSRPPLDFEAGKRSRVFLAPERWRIGAVPLPATDPAGVR
jgi:hypothetical protein